MKNIAKGQSPQGFEKWKALESADWIPTYGSLRGEEKRALHLSLLREQGWVCCYCGRAVGEDDSHIEHFRPQDGSPRRSASSTGRLPQ